MAMFERRALPHRATLSRFLAAVDGPCVEAVRALFVSSSLTWGWTPETIGGLWDRAGRRSLVFDIDGTREAARQRALPGVPTLPPPKRRLDDVCAPGYKGRRRGEVVRTRTAVLQMHTRQWLGTFGGKGNGDYRGELAAALDVVGTYLTAWDLPRGAGIVRVDGQYGDLAIIAQIMATGLHLVVRGRGYTLLEQPQVQAVLTQTVPVTISLAESQLTYEVFDILDVPLLPDGQPDPVRVRVIVTRHAWTGAPIAVGKRVGMWVYELFLTTLPPDGFRAADVLDLYHGRGAFEGTLADEDVEGDPDRWCSYAAHGQELWQVIWQWVWNLRLALGQRLEGVADCSVRSMEWAPSLPATAVDLPVAMKATSDETTAEYGPLEWAQPRGRAKGSFGAEAFTLREDGMLQCPAGKLLWLSETRQESATTQRLIYVARDQDCASCAVRDSCVSQSASGKRGRRVSARRRRRAPPVTTVACSLGEHAMYWQDVAGRRLRRVWMTHWRSQVVTIGMLPPGVPHPAQPPRAARGHRRLGWDERLGRNARAPLRLATIHVAGVCPALLEVLSEGAESGPS
jgi:Transposase DDE domain